MPRGWLLRATSYSTSGMATPKDVGEIPGQELISRLDAEAVIKALPPGLISHRIALGRHLAQPFL